MVPTARDGVWAPGLTLAGPVADAGWPGVPHAGPLAPFQSQDRARVSPTFQPVRVDIHARGGSA